jgi:mycofactocin precursor
MCLSTDLISESPTATLEARPAPSAATAQDSSAQHDDADLLIEDVSIDGMCGVY